MILIFLTLFVLIYKTKVLWEWICNNKIYDMIPKYFAQIDNKNIVINLAVVESASYAHEIFGGNWVETFTNDPTKNYASKGSIFVPELNNFYKPQPYPNWILNDKLRWIPQNIDQNIMIIPEYIKPKIIITDDDKIYKWDNKISKWDEV